MVIKAPAVTVAPITYWRRINERPSTGGKEPPRVGKVGGAVIVRCGHHGLCMTLNLPHVDPESRVRVEVDRATRLLQQTASLGALTSGSSTSRRWLNGTRRFCPALSFVAIEPQGGRHLRPGCLTRKGQVEAELAHACSLPRG